jgi:hypothetical protein
MSIEPLDMSEHLINVRASGKLTGPYSRIKASGNILVMNRRE